MKDKTKLPVGYASELLPTITNDLSIGDNIILLNRNIYDKVDQVIYVSNLYVNLRINPSTTYFKEAKKILIKESKDGFNRISTNIAMKMGMELDGFDVLRLFYRKKFYKIDKYENVLERASKEKNTRQKQKMIKKARNILNNLSNEEIEELQLRTRTINKHLIQPSKSSKHVHQLTFTSE